MDATELQETKNGRDALELVVEQVKLKTKEEKEHVDRMEQGLTLFIIASQTMHKSWIEAQRRRSTSLHKPLISTDRILRS
jgi:hypothetical protein